jgi:hypothetical protein
VLLRLSYLALTNGFALVRLLPVSDVDRTSRSLRYATSSPWAWSAEAAHRHVVNWDGPSCRQCPVGEVPRRAGRGRLLLRRVGNSGVFPSSGGLRRCALRPREFG